MEPLYFQTIRGQAIPVSIVEIYSENNMPYYVLKVKRNKSPYRVGDIVTALPNQLATKSGRVNITSYIERDKPIIHPGVII